MKISVGMITYNMEKYIFESLMSVLSQKEFIDEIVICDDASTDNTIKVASELLKTQNDNVSYKIVRNPQNLGNKLNAMKCYCKECSGDVVIVVDPDDISMPNRFKIIIEKFKNPNVCMVFSDAGVFFDNEKEEIISLWESLGFSEKEVSSQNAYYRCITKRFTVSGCTMAFRRDFAKECYQIPQNCAWDMFLAWMAPFYGDVVAINEQIVLYRQHSNNDSHTVRKQNKIITNKIIRVNNAIKKPIEKYFFDNLYFGQRFLEFIKHKNDNNKTYVQSLEKAESFYKSMLSLLSTNHKIERIKILCRSKKMGLYDIYRGNNNQFILDIINLLFH